MTAGRPADDFAVTPGEQAWYLSQILREWERLKRASGRPVAQVVLDGIASLERPGALWEIRRWLTASDHESSNGDTGSAELVSVTAAANLLGCSEPTVRRWCRSGRLAGRKTGRDWLVHLSSVAEQKRG